MAVGLLGVGSACIVVRVARGDEQLACKRLLPRHRDAPAARRGLIREARALELARHPALPTLREVGADDAGPYLLETVVEGISLRELKSRWDGRVPPLLARHLTREAARTVGALHALADEEGPIELVHGDLGPDNLWVTPAGGIAVLDLGAARYRGFDAAHETGDRGTAPYAAPEVVRGDATPSQGSDVYALAATVAWTLLDGDAPLADPLPEAARLAAIGSDGIDPARLAPLPPALRDALRGLLEVDPARRVGDLHALAHVLANPHAGPAP